MSRLRARVEKGRRFLDEPTALPEGAVVDLVADGEGDDLTDDGLGALHHALSESRNPRKRVTLRSTSGILDELRRLR